MIGAAEREGGRENTCEKERVMEREKKKKKRQQPDNDSGG